MRKQAGMLRRSAASGFVALILTLATFGCGVLNSDEDHPREARVVVTGTSPVPLQLITTTQFVFEVDNSGNRVVRMLTADTSTIDVLPHDRTFAFGNSNRFLVRVANLDADQTATIQLRLLIDGKEVFNDAASMRDASLQYTYVNP